MQQINKGNHARSSIHRFVYFTHIENTFDTWTNVLTNEI